MIKIRYFRNNRLCYAEDLPDRDAASEKLQPVLALLTAADGDVDFENIGRKWVLSSGTVVYDVLLDYVEGIS